MHKIWFIFLLLCCAVSAWAQNPPYKVENIELKMLTGESCKLPSWGDKHILIFYVDPDRHQQNEAFTYELEENGRTSSPKIEAFGVLNLKDTILPNGIIRSMTRKRIAKSGALVLSDEKHTLSSSWNLGDCNNKFVLIFISKDGELLFVRKGELTEQDKQDFYALIEQCRNR